MPENEQQRFENHARWVPGYHFVTGFMLLAVTLWFLYRAIIAFSIDNLALGAMSVGLLMTFFYARAFPAGNQDRIIRLEERLRLARLLPDDLRDRIDEFSASDLVALRFASDAEIPDLARRVLAKELTDPAEIKKQISNWRPDHQRI